MRLQDRPALAGHGGVRLRRLRRRGRRRPGRSPSPACTRPTAGCSTPPRRSSTPAPAVGGGLLVLAFESADHPVDPWLDRALEIARDHGGEPPTPYARASTARSGDDGDAAATWRSSFLRMPYLRDEAARHGHGRRDVRDRLHLGPVRGRRTAASPPRAQDAVERVCGTGVVTCRFTHVYPDGPAPYYGVYAPGRWGSTVAQWDEIKAAVSEAIADHRRHDHPPPRGRPRPPAVVRPPAARRFATALGAARARARPGRDPQPGRAAVAAIAPSSCVREVRLA